jgi:integrase
VLSYAKARGLRAGENPARWREHLKEILPSPREVRKVVHHPSCHYKALPEFMAALRQRQGITPRVLAFAILAGGRTDEVLGARWEEFDLTEKKKEVWSIPPERMKSDRLHRVPLTQPMLDILAEMAGCRRNEFVFPGVAESRLHSDALDGVLRRMKSEYTTHGFRSTFRTWVEETQYFPRDLAEVALAHNVGDETERSYQRGDLLEKRRLLMEAWSAFATKPPIAGDVVVPIRKGVA